MPENLDLQKIVNQAAQTAEHWFSIGESLRRQIPNKPDEPGKALVWAFGYNYAEATETERRERWGAFAPSIEMQDGVFRPPVRDIDEQSIKVWADIAEKSDNPVIQTR